MIGEFIDTEESYLCELHYFVLLDREENLENLIDNRYTFKITKKHLIFKKKLNNEIKLKV